MMWELRRLTVARCGDRAGVTGVRTFSSRLRLCPEGFDEPYLFWLQEMATISGPARDPAPSSRASYPLHPCARDARHRQSAEAPSKGPQAGRQAAAGHQEPSASARGARSGRVGGQEQTPITACGDGAADVRGDRPLR